jgi:hypothetical protein
MWMTGRLYSVSASGRLASALRKRKIVAQRSNAPLRSSVPLNDFHYFNLTPCEAMIHFDLSRVRMLLKILLFRV